MTDTEIIASSSLFAFLFGSFVTICAFMWAGPLNMSDLKTALHQCEKSLPRDQHCVYQFIPEKKE